MARKALSPVAEQAAGLVQQAKETEVEAAFLEKKLGKERWEIVALLRELDDAGLGRFVPGRHGYQTRFVKSAPTSASTNINSEEYPADDASHVFVLKREVPLRIVLPADLSRLEADRIVRWVNALPDD